MALSKLTDLERCEIRDYYVDDKYSTCKLAKMYNTSTSQISLYLRQQGIITRQCGRMRKYALNEFYFDEIDTEGNAYFLGILFADGNNSVKKGVIKLGLHEKDVELLEKLKRLIGYNGPVIYESCETKRKNSGYNSGDMYSLNFTSRILSAQLDDLGMWADKSSILEYPDCITKGLHRHFIRGYIDGDGNIAPRAVRFRSTFEFCTRISSLLKDANIKIQMYKEERCQNNYNFCIHTKVQCKAFLDWIYEGSTIYMDRKYQSYLEYYC